MTVIGLIFLTPTRTTLAKQKMLGPAGVIVQVYCALDAMAAGISSATVPYILELTDWEDGPGWDMVTLIDGFEIVDETYKGGLAQVTVKYSITAELTPAPQGGAIQKFQKKTETAVFKLKQTGQTWKITQPQNRPHILHSVANQYDPLKSSSMGKSIK